MINNLKEVLSSHEKWLKGEKGGEVANLRGANLQGANLRGADLQDYMICPEIGSFIAYKKTGCHVITLEIPENAKRTSTLIGRKCRAEFVKVVKIEDPKGNQVKSVTGGYLNTTYTKGEKTFPDRYNDDIRIECTNGIHFFITRKEAEGY